MPDHDTGDALIAAVRKRFREGLARIEHCLDQLSDDDVHWRPYDAHNSVGTILLHLSGNVRQWIISGIGGADDVRERSLEFTDRRRHAPEDLLAPLRATVQEADAVLAALDPATLTDPRRIQGFELDGVTAIIDTAAHFEGHVQEITWITRTRVGASYVFRWEPTTPEQGAPAS
ncbi:MAG: DUF1572 domain-containing protein [Planctomycetes bacterium]|nr:DUF1572 domain-containing protein [Planctomycetota bacterium]